MTPHLVFGKTGLKDVPPVNVLPDAIGARGQPGYSCGFRSPTARGSLNPEPMPVKVGKSSNIVFPSGKNEK